MDECAIRIEKLLNGNGYAYEPPENTTVNFMYNILIKEEIPKDTSELNGEELFCIGMHCKIKGMLDEMIKYWMLSIKRGDANTMNNYGFYCEDHKELDKAIKYYSMAIRHGHVDAVWNLALLYKNKNEYYLLDELKSIVCTDKQRCELERFFMDY